MTFRQAQRRRTLHNGQSAIRVGLDHKKWARSRSRIQAALTVQSPGERGRLHHGHLRGRTPRRRRRNHGQPGRRIDLPGPVHMGPALLKQLTPETILWASYGPVNPNWPQLNPAGTGGSRGPVSCDPMPAAIRCDKGRVGSRPSAQDGAATARKGQTDEPDGPVADCGDGAVGHRRDRPGGSRVHRVRQREPPRIL